MFRVSTTLDTLECLYTRVSSTSRNVALLHLSLGAVGERTEITKSSLKAVPMRQPKNHPHQVILKRLCFIILKVFAHTCVTLLFCQIDVLPSKITVVDPEEVVQARYIAIAQASFEAMLVMFCRSEWCAWAWLIAMPFSIIVASCCKHRVTYIAWGSTNVLVCWFHVEAAVEVLGRHDGGLYSTGYPREFLTTVQFFLLSVGVLAVYTGFKTASALRNEVLPHARAEVLAITQESSAYPPVEEHYPQPPPMSVPLR